MNKRFSKVVSLILACIIIGTIPNVSAVAFESDTFLGQSAISENLNSKLQTDSNLTVGKIISNEKLDTSNIKIDIYYSTLVNDDEGIKEYDNTYYKTVYTNKNGEFHFDKPSGKYLISVDLDSIPAKTGVSDNSIFVESNNKIKPIQLATIDDIKIEDNDIENVKLFDKLGNSLTSKVDVKSEISDENSISTWLSDSINSITSNVSINANGVHKLCTLSQDISNYTQFEKIDLLKSLKLINEDKKIELYLDQIKKSTLQNSDRSYTLALEDINDFYENNRFKGNVALANSINDYTQYDTALRSAVAPTTASYSIEGTTIVDNFYKLHFENDPQSANYISEYKRSQLIYGLSNICYYYYNTNTFPRPEKELDEDYYHIYLTPTGGNFTQRLSEGSYINIELNGTTAINSELFETFAHEIFHSIMYEYNYHRGADNWFAEAFASFAGVGYLNYSLNCNSNWGAQMATNYFNTTETSLDQGISAILPRNYGSFVLPKYIYEKNGGMATIKTILSKLPNNKNSINAIVEGLRDADYGYSFKKSFAGCSAYNLRPQMYYTHSTNWTSLDVTRNNNNYTNETINPDAAKYYGYTDTSSTSNQITITVNCSDNESFFKLKFMRHRGNGLPDIHDVSDFTPTSTSKTIIVPYFKTGVASEKINKVTVVATNSNTIPSESATFSISAVVS